MFNVKERVERKAAEAAAARQARVDEYAILSDAERQAQMCVLLEDLLAVTTQGEHHDRLEHFTGTTITGKTRVHG